MCLPAEPYSLTLALASMVAFRCRQIPNLLTKQAIDLDLVVAEMTDVTRVRQSTFCYQSTLGSAMEVVDDMPIMTTALIELNEREGCQQLRPSVPALRLALYPHAMRHCAPFRPPF
jgi:hypothetical protein